MCSSSTVDPKKRSMLEAYIQTKSNRDDGSYATGDLYTPHPTKKGVWRYVGRGDDVIVMVSSVQSRKQAELVE